MKIKCIAIGKTKNQELISIIKSYISKIKHYINFEFVIINDIKSRKNKKVQKNKEGELILDLNDEIISGAMYTHKGEITHQPTNELASNN